MPFARDLHPEFGYLGTPGFFRTLGVVVSCVALGLAAGASGLKSSPPPPDSRSDPVHAMAHAPTEGLVAAIPPAAKTSRDIQSTQLASGHAISELGILKSPCRELTTEALGSDCTPLRIVKPDPAYAASRRPAIATVPIGHRHDPAALAPEPAAPVVAARPADAEPGIPAEAAPAAAPRSPALPPAVAAKRGSTSGRSDARAAKGADAHATAASMHPRRATTATAKPAESEDRRGSGNRVAHRRAGQGAAGIDAFLAGDEVPFDRRRKPVAAFTKALGIHMPPRLLDLAGKALE
jgi:hypothetical protein